jgi:hypothetical protein
MPYDRPNMTLAAPAIIARQAAAPPVEESPAKPAPPASRQEIDLGELAERVYQLMRRNTLIEQERRA